MDLILILVKRRVKMKMIKKFVEPEERLIFALDVSSTKEAIDEKLNPVLGKTKWVKVNSVFFGPARDYAVNKIINAGSLPMIDIKAHDIPTSTARNVVEVSRVGAAIVTVHAVATRKAMETVMEEVEQEAGEKRPIILAITVLTSIKKEVLNDELGIPGEVLDHVLRRAKLAQKSGFDGIVCSPEETEYVRETCGGEFIIVNPGIRFAGKKERDQERVGTPKGTIIKGATALVMGSDLLKDPVNNIPRAIEEIRLGLLSRQ
jgi:orotidine-5'-phosphate decarboxylase